MVAAYSFVTRFFLSFVRSSTSIYNDDESNKQYSNGMKFEIVGQILQAFSIEFQVCTLSSRLACASIFDRSNLQRAAVETTVVEVKMIIRFRFVWKSLYSLCRPVIRNCIVFLLSSQQQEQDPTNLYIANLPLTFKENDVEALLAQYGQVISTRILRDTSGQSKGVGFARFARNP